MRGIDPPSHLIALAAPVTTQAGGGGGGQCGTLEPLVALEPYRGLALSSWANHFASLSLSFFICKMGIIIGPTS